MSELLTIDEHEAEHWRNGLREFDAQNELIAFAIMCAFTKPETWLDVGCGTGAIVRAALANGVDAFGIDQLAQDDKYFKRVDLRAKIELPRQFQFVTCIEVAEHLQEEYEGEICDTMVRHVAPNGKLIFTAAKPGQGGYNHFNCQPQKYWRDRLESRGLRYSLADTMRLKEIWTWTFTALHHLEENLQVFTR